MVEDFVGGIVVASTEVGIFTNIARVAVINCWLKTNNRKLMQNITKKESAKDILEM